MSAITSDRNWLELTAEYPSVRKVFERHGVSWLVDITDPGRSAHLLEEAAAISGVSPAEFQAEVDQAIAQIAPRPMTRRLLWREPSA